MRFKSEPAAKRAELKTYASLELKRSLKSKVQRRRLVEKAQRVILGSGEPGEPEIVVTREAYNRTRLEVMQRLLAQARRHGIELGPEVLLEHFNGRVERETYERLREELQGGGRIDAAVVRLQRRHATREERRLLTQVAPVMENAEQRAQAQRGDLLHEVLTAIDKQRQSSSVHLQTVWAEVLGELAHQSELVRVEQGVAYFRCFNAALRSHLQRKPELPRELAQRLRQPVRQLRGV